MFNSSSIDSVLSLFICPVRRVEELFSDSKILFFGLFTYKPLSYVIILTLLFDTVPLDILL